MTVNFPDAQKLKEKCIKVLQLLLGCPCHAFQSQYLMIQIPGDAS